MPNLQALEISADAFADYGEVFEPASATARVDHLARLQNGRPAAKPNLFAGRTGLTSLPHRFTKMESHPWSSQSFVPLGPAPIVLAVALPGPDGQPDLSTLKAFVTRGQGFSYRAGTWHLPIAALGEPTAFVGFMYEDGTPEDCVWADVEPTTLAAA